MPVTWGKALRQQSKNAFCIAIVCTTAAVLTFRTESGSVERRYTNQVMLFAIISSLVIQQDDIGNAGKWMVARLAGTMIGGSVGVAFCYFIDRQGLFGIVGAVLSGLVSVGAVLIIRSTGQVKGEVLMGNQAAVPAVLLCWDIYANPSINAVELAECRICGVLYGLFISTFASLVIFPHAASDDLLAKMPSLLARAKTLNACAWGVIMNEKIQDDYDKDRDLLLSDAKAIRDLFPKAKLERYFRICGHKVWLPAAFSCGGASLDTKVAESYVKAVLTQTRFFTCVVGVIGGRLCDNDFDLLNDHYGNVQDKKATALSMLQEETMLAIERCEDAMKNMEAVPESACSAVLACAQAMLKKSESNEGTIFKESTHPGRDIMDLRHRWNTFTLMYAEGMQAMENLSKATNSWIVSLREDTVHSNAKSIPLLRDP